MLPSVGVGALAIAGAAVVTQPAASVSPEVDRVTLAASEVSRSGERPVLASEAQVAQSATGALWVVADADIRSDASDQAPSLATAEEGTQVLVTGVVEGDWTQVLHNDLPRWIASSAVSAVEPLGTQPCPGGSSVESGLKADTVKVHRAVCAKFPEISTYGGVAERSGNSGHPSGRALDIMVSGSKGDEIAQFVMDHYEELGVTQIIWQQRIWEPGGGWRGMSDRGGATANHMDHVHVTTSGNAAQ